MNKIYVVIRSVGEETTKKCMKEVEKIFGQDFFILENYKPLEKAAKATIQIGAMKADAFDWIYAVDADVILTKSRKWYEKIAEDMKVKFSDRLFCFNGWLECSERGKIVGSHFFRTRYCQKVLGEVKDVSFQYKPGREESELCWYVRDKMALGTVSSINEEFFGKHLKNNK